MTLFNNLLNKIADNNQRVARGEHLFIDIERFFPRLSQFVPGFVKEDNIIITGSSGIGKSKLARYLFAEIPIAIAKETNLSVRVIYNTLEESKTKFAATFVCRYIKQKHNISLTYRDMMYPKANNPHSDRVMAAIEDGREYYASLEPYLDVVSLANPMAAYLHVRDYLRTVGKFYQIERDVNGREIGRKFVSDKKDQWNHYEYDDPNHFIIFVSDNINNYGSIEGRDWYKSIKHFSSRLCRKYLNLTCGVITVMIHQQASDQENISGNYTASTLEQKLAPSLSGLGDIKINQRDVTLALGLFAPSRYKMIRHYAGWDMSKIGPYFRSVHVLKNREGFPDKIIPLEVDWAADVFTELPDISSNNFRNPAIMSSIYDKYST